VSGGLRLFIAAEPPQAVREELAAWARRALGRSAQAHRLSTDSLHLTLCFLGEQDPSAVAEIAGMLRASAESFAAVDELALGAPLWLPPRSPRVLAVGVGDPTGALEALRGGLARELAALLGWDAGRERFRPHVTVARMRAGSHRARALPPTPALRFAPAALTLFRSTLDPGGARYDPLASVPA
jgi:2'-5' RNA ligase